MVDDAILQGSVRNWRANRNGAIDERVAEAKKRTVLGAWRIDVEYVVAIIDRNDCTGVAAVIGTGYGDNGTDVGSCAAIHADKNVGFGDRNVGWAAIRRVGRQGDRLTGNRKIALRGRKIGGGDSGARKRIQSNVIQAESDERAWRMNLG